VASGAFDVIQNWHQVTDNFTDSSISIQFSISVNSSSVIRELR
jgi:hypothetical protein